MPKVVQDHEKCIGCGACVSVCPENWEFGDDGKARPKKTEISEEELPCNKKAAEICPIQIIKIIE